MNRETSSDQWSDDLLSRKQYATFLTGFLARKAVPGESGTVMALDAPWGLGKTFFIRHWAADLVASGHPCIVFDAWKNDSSEQPAVAFMAELRESLRPIQQGLGAGTKAELLAQKSEEVVSNLRKATLPALTVIGKALLKKATGVAIDDVVDAMTGDDDEQGVGEAAPDAVESGLDVFFDKALQGHTERLKSIEAFRSSLEQLVVLLRDQQVSMTPLFVFIDELDRCRPDYAIRLLEEIKHLFSVKGVAFVVSTNLAQLAKAVGAVYGPSFEGYLYLKRFFDFEYILPEPTREAFLGALLPAKGLDELPGISGLDPALPEADRTHAKAFTALAEAFRLDLRTLQRVLTITEAAVAGRQEQDKFVTLWLFFLAILRHLRPDVFHRVKVRSIPQPDLLTVCGEMIVGRAEIDCMMRTGRGMGPRSRASVAQALIELYGISLTEPADLRREAQRLDDPWAVPYPQNNRFWVLDLFPTVPVGSYLSRHAALIESAGHLVK